MRVRALAYLAIAWLLCFAGIVPGHAEKRVALVIGNGAYTYADPLANPVNDARGMRAALDGIGFDVVYGEDLDQNALRRTIGRFADIAQDADVAVVYFAGHGATFGDTPYVVPIDARFSSLGQVPYELVSVETLIGELRRVKGVRIAILDACRDNAAEGRLKRQATRGGETSRGLGPMRNPDGLILAYATQYLSTAADSGGGRNSPFTAALLKNIATPGLDVKDLFFKVGREVVAATGGKQRPEIAVSIYDQYALVPAASQAALPTSSPAPARPPELQTAVAAPPVALAVPPADPCGGAVTAKFPFPCAPLTAGQERRLMPKDDFRECANCPEMVVVPAGSFTMGSPKSEFGRNNDESPQHRVTFARPFAVGKFAVTFDEWDGCVTDGGCNGYKPSDAGWGRGRRPVINVSWDDANAYIAWVSRTTGKNYRMLTEAEREYVTRAGTSTPFWWGKSISPQQGNYNPTLPFGNSPKGVYREQTLPVDTLQPNPWGLFHVHGNAAEWTDDCYENTYQGAPTNGSARVTGDCSVRVVRGGSWSQNGPADLRAANRYGFITTDRRINDLGFRVGRTLMP